MRPGYLAEFDGFFDKGFSRIVGTLNLHSLLPQFFPPPPEPEEPDEPDDEDDDEPGKPRSKAGVRLKAYSRATKNYYIQDAISREKCKPGEVFLRPRRRKHGCARDRNYIPFPKGTWKNCQELISAFKRIPEKFSRRVCKDLNLPQALSKSKPKAAATPAKLKARAKPKPKVGAPKPTAKPKAKALSPAVKACVQGAHSLLTKGLITRVRFPKGIQAYCEEKNKPQAPSPLSGYVRRPGNLGNLDGFWFANHQR